MFAGIIAPVLIGSFFLSTVSVEIWGSRSAIAAVKEGIAWALLGLIPTMAALGLSGVRLAGGSTSPRLKRKTARMKLVGANGLLLLTPCALLLHWLASQGSFGPLFYTVQGVELVAGATNLYLIGLNVREGLELSGRLNKKTSMTL